MSVEASTLPPGVYLHVPFCSVRCDYCAFATFTDKADLMSAYVDAVIEELGLARRDGRLGPAKTLFVGGGTPSLLAPFELARLIAAVEVVDGAEVTVECNPESVTDALMAELRHVGVNRISIGVQSLAPHVLRGLGRPIVEGALSHALGCIDRAGISSFNVDLVYGGHGETTDDWRRTLDGVLSMSPRPPHISAYALTIEPGTPLAKDPSRYPDDDQQAERYELCDQMLSDAGYRWYEISNFAEPGQECRHNQSCWRQEDYLGFGCAAHSHVAGRRFQNVWNIERYLERINEGRSAIASTTQLSDEQRAIERLELAIRTADGVDKRALADADVAALAGLIDVRDDRIVLTRSGRMLANEVIMRLRSDEEETGTSRVNETYPRDETAPIRVKLQNS